ncbi:MULTISPECIES: DNA oxidative demethylase AlkB [Acidithiobacillus]|uniref:Alpha-ketoglutarate-dependent dioxygenase AlkB n=2 Tax=Acidithiobacillus thiooxidans TaxID=930 RepID=A0A1C2IVQ1_ACITH|nr:MULTISPECIES: DNA oxidative demethylase AlkB [Acidithiobacillus]MBU2741045.1 DNA oxidative demethylase AlkB [Acidithiobacillus albertensis]MBU2834588.1 DNA oxidative demethylase AlkB [Acidithiobacillus thiooxidans]MBU2842542.1 DNA oxidative demethylase AlkB [Acidithiobacillus thiooxidans]MDA8176767.1 DNA oxidative demethylase AlkB [Acidithiobacillus sp.]OCX77274.1 alpha-ketoglutarate-dependent dioxygenase AlkB [Acidithiobacillus thiooxidans]
MTADLFENFLLPATAVESLEEGATILRGWALADAESLIHAVQQGLMQSALRQMSTPGGKTMSVAMSNFGSWGWVSDRQGYRYVSKDPENAEPWPEIPAIILNLAQAASKKAGFAGFTPDACLVNVYVPGARMSLHQDKDEQDMDAPIVSISLGLPATFLFGGAQRRDKVKRIFVEHGDVLVWGGPARLRYHGVAPIKPGEHPLVGARRINLTLRKAH